jgi:hypothetical protein
LVAGLGDGDDLVEGQDLGLAVEGGAGRAQLRQALAGAQGLDLGQGEVLGEPAGQALAVDGLGRLAGGEFGMAGDIGRAADLVLVTGHQMAVLGRDQIGLDEVAPCSMARS